MLNLSKTKTIISKPKFTTGFTLIEILLVVGKGRLADTENLFEMRFSLVMDLGNFIIFFFSNVLV